MLIGSTVSTALSRARTSFFLIVKESFLPSHNTSLYKTGVPPFLFPTTPPNLGWGCGNLSPHSDGVPAPLGLAPLLWSVRGPLASAPCTLTAAHPTPGCPTPISQPRKYTFAEKLRTATSSKLQRVARFSLFEELTATLVFTVVLRAESLSIFGKGPCKLSGACQLLPEDHLGREFYFIT